MLQNRSKAVRLISVAVAALFLFVSIFASTESVNAASKLKVTTSRKIIYIGQTAKLKANKNVKWSLSKKKIVKMTYKKRRTLTVKGLKAGVVYVKAKAGRSTRSIKIIVRSRVPKSIKLAATKNILGAAESCSVYVKSVTPSYASSGVEYSSSDPDVATVNSVGFVTGLSPGTAKITARSVKSKKVTASVTIRVVAAKAGILTATIDMTDPDKYPAGKAVKAWFQVPESDNNQRVAILDHSAVSATVEEFIKDSSGATAYYVEWDESVAPADRTAAITFEVYRREVFHDESIKSKEKGTVDTAKFEEWLKPTTMSGLQTDGEVEKLAADIVSDAGATTVYDKAHAIYLWICDNITRDKNKANRELGDVATILTGDRVAGSCIDINSIFVALCNAEGIPARESFGYKIYEGSSDVTGTKLGQNCRAEFYLPGYGWVEVDPAMPLGLVMNHRIEKGGLDWENAKETYWISGSADWICQNHGRDLTFDAPGEMNAAPGYMVNEDGTLNHFMFPHAEVDGQYIPGWGNYAADFRYVYDFVEESVFDCGC